MSMSTGIGHLSFANSCYHVLEAAPVEQRSIDDRDLFGTDVSDEAYDFGYNPSVQNPFADYLRQAVSQLDTDAIEVAPDDLQFEIAKAMPSYKICSKELDYITDSDWLAKFALRQGYLKLRDIPEDLLVEERTPDRVAWLISKIPPDVRARQEEFLAEMEEWKLELSKTPLEGGGK